MQTVLNLTHKQGRHQQPDGRRRLATSADGGWLVSMRRIERRYSSQPESQRRLQPEYVKGRLLGTAVRYTSKLPELVEAATHDVPDVLVHRQFTVNNDAEVTNFVQRRYELIFNLQWRHSDLRHLLACAKPDEFCLFGVQFQPIVHCVGLRQSKFNYKTITDPVSQLRIVYS